MISNRTQTFLYVDNNLKQAHTLWNFKYQK